MRTTANLTLGLLGLLGVIVAGCSVSTSPNSITFKSQTKYTGEPQAKEAAAAWNGEEIAIDNKNGDVVVVGDPNTTKVSVTATPFAFADGKDAQKGTTGEPDAQAALKEVIASVVIEETGGKITVRCGQANGGHGSAAQGTTGCDGFTVHVPSGSAQKGLTLSAIAENGSNTATNLTAADGAQIQIGSGNGTVSATGIVGGANVKADNGDLTASITPTKGCEIAVTTGNGDITLSLPSDFAADAISLTAGGKVTIDPGIVGLTATSTSKGTPGTGAKSITAKASSLGDLNVLTQK
jgi:hypothetical protein